MVSLSILSGPPVKDPSGCCVEMDCRRRGGSRDIIRRLLEHAWEERLVVCLGESSAGGEQCWNSASILKAHILREGWTISVRR